MTRPDYGSTKLATELSPPPTRPAPSARAGEFMIRQSCQAPAPLVVNGAAYVGCQRDKGHEGHHEVTIQWGERSS